MSAPLPSPLLAAPGAGVPDVPAARLDEWFDRSALRRNRRYRRGAWALGVAGMAVAPVWTATVVVGGRRWRPPLVRLVAGRPLPAALAFGAGLVVASEVVRLPIGAAGFAWSRAHGLVTQSARGWVADRAKATALGAGFAGALSLAAATLMRRRPGTWWLGTWAVASAGTVGLTLLGPKLIEPLFQSTEPLDDPELDRRGPDVAGRLGGAGARRRGERRQRAHHGANAYVSGLADAATSSCSTPCCATSRATRCGASWRTSWRTSPAATSCAGSRSRGGALAVPWRLLVGRGGRRRHRVCGGSDRAGAT